MAGVVVGVHHADACGAAVRWASAAAELRGLPLALVHAWNEPLDLTVELGPVTLPDLAGPAASCAVHGPPAAALLAHRPDLLVLGGHHGARHLGHVTRTCLHHATCPVVVVPDTEQSPAGRIAVGVCGTEASHTALRWAAREAQLRHADLLVCYAWQFHPSSVRDLLHSERLRPVQQGAALGRLRQWVDRALGAQQIEVQVTHGGPLDGLLEASAGVDLIVVGGSAHSGPGRLLHGVVSDDLSGLAPCPIAVIPRAYAATPTPV